MRCAPSVLVVLACCGAPGPSATLAPVMPQPELYGAGLFSTGAWDFFMAFTPDQQRALFCRADDTFGRYEIFETEQRAGRWSPPVHPAFARAWSNADPHISPDGRRVFFISNRPNPGETAERATYDIWTAARAPDGSWGEAERVAVSDPSVDEWSPSVAANGDLYFGTERPDSRGGTDLYVSRWADGAYQPAENLGDAINTPGLEVEPWISPDEQLLIFSALKRPDSLGSYDLYVSRKVDGAWTPARHLPAPINSPDRDFNQSVSPDGAYLYFSSTRPRPPGAALGPRFDEPRDDAAVRGIGNGKTGDIYRVPIAALGR